MPPTADLRTLRAEVRRLKARLVVEFGPGGTTLALRDGGARVITLEHDAKWLRRARSRFARCPRIQVMWYRNETTCIVPNLSDSARFDLAFVDSPQGANQASYTEHVGQEGLSRYNTVVWALKRAPVVLLHDAGREGEQRTLARIIEEGYSVEVIGPRKNIARITSAA